MGGLAAVAGAAVAGAADDATPAALAPLAAGGLAAVAGAADDATLAALAPPAEVYIKKKSPIYCNPAPSR